MSDFTDEKKQEIISEIISLLAKREVSVQQSMELLMETSRQIHREITKLKVISPV